MALWIQISSGSNEPIYAQIVRQISQAMARGELAAGDKLPAVRKLAAELVINPNTVARAYSELEQQGLVASKTGAGTFVSDPALRGKDMGRVNVIAERMDNIISEALNMALSGEDIKEMFEKRLSNFEGRTDSRRRKDE